MKIDNMDRNPLLIENLNYLFNKNLLFFKYHRPDLYEKFHNFELTNVRLVVDENGEINFFYKDLIGYPYDPAKFCKDQVDNYGKNSYEVSVNPSNKPTPDTLFHNYLKKLSDLYSFDKYPPYERDPDNKNLTILTIIGVGLGYHIEYLIQKFDVGHLIIYEPDHELFYISLYTTDWENVFRHFEKKNGTIYLHLKPNIKPIIQNIKEINPVLANYSIIYNHFNDHNTIVSIVRELSLLFRGFGFYDDEKWSVQHTSANLKYFIPVYSPMNTAKTIDKNATAFIVGAGPSLDNEIETIKKYRDRVVVFSCGTALKTLEKNGIKPDFHMEIERTYDTYEALKTIDPNYLKEITIIGNSTLHPDVFPLFKNRFMFLKVFDSGAKLFPQFVPHLGFSNPTVGNAAMAMVTDLGFKNIYLFGVDMGFKDPHYHHSHDNVAMDQNTQFYMQQMEGRKQVDGNFCDKVYTTSTLLWSKDMIEAVLHLYTDVNAYNCSDGAKIFGTIPLKSDNIDIPATNIPKEETIDVVKAYFSDEYLKHMQLDKAVSDFYEPILEILDNLIYVLTSKKIIIRLQLADVFYYMYHYVRQSPMLKGIVLHFQLLIYLYAFLEKDESVAVDGVNKGLDIFKELLEKVKDDILSQF